MGQPRREAADEQSCRCHQQGAWLYKVERPEIEPWDFEQYARLLFSAKVEGADWYAAACLAGEAGLRSGEIKALRWRKDVDLIARTITVNQQTCYGETTKVRTRRRIPMTSTLEQALRRLEVVREGFVVRNLDARGSHVAANLVASEESSKNLAS